MIYLKRNILFYIMFFLIFFSCNKSNPEMKAKFYRDALSEIPVKYKKVKILIVYNEKFEDENNGVADLRVNSSQQALDAYKEGISNPYFIDTIDINSEISPPDSGCYVGVFSGWGELEDSVTYEKIKNFEDMVNKKVAFVPFSNFWGENYASDMQLKEIEKYGAVPILRFMPWGDYWIPQNDSDYSLEKIINGQFDSFLKKWADIVKKYEKPLMITFGVEMNGNWFPWSGIFQGAGDKNKYGDPEKPDGPEKYVDAYRHIVELFRQEGADNAVWLFQVNHECIPDEEWNSIENYYPGDSYVDWVGFSLYGAQYENEEWKTFDEIMKPIYDKMITLFPNKPLMIPEWGVREW